MMKTITTSMDLGNKTKDMWILTVESCKRANHTVLSLKLINCGRMHRNRTKKRKKILILNTILFVMDKGKPRWK